jgi:DNA-binding IclR family transcriptional regulator
MMSRATTRREADLLAIVLARPRGTVRSWAESMGCGHSAAHGHLSALVRKGWLVREPVSEVGWRHRYRVADERAARTEIRRWTTESSNF